MRSCSSCVCHQIIICILELVSPDNRYLERLPDNRYKICLLESQYSSLVGQPGIATIVAKDESIMSQETFKLSGFITIAGSSEE